jgi:hypothetical protein
MTREELVKVMGQAMRDYAMRNGIVRTWDDYAQAALAAIEAAGCMVVPGIDEAALVEITDDCGWSLSICFGHGDKNRDRMHAYSDALRAMLTAAPMRGEG